MVDMDEEWFEMYGRSTTVTTSTGRKGGVGGRLDLYNISEESFLPMQGEGGLEIRKTMQVDVSSSTSADRVYPQTHVEDRV